MTDRAHDRGALAGVGAPGYRRALLGWAMVDRGDWRLQTTALSEDERAALLARQLGRRFSGMSLLIFGADGVEAIPLTEGNGFVVGRDAPADRVIDDESLSRQHAHVELLDGVVWVEDLKSTNGTWVDGQQIQRSQVGPGLHLAFGSVAASVHAMGATDSIDLGLDSHDRLRRELESEVARAREFHRPLALVMLRSRVGTAHVAYWIDACRERLREFDRVALYSPDTVEVLLAETGREEAERFARELAVGTVPLFAGVAVSPDHASSAEALLSITRVALLEATEEDPVRLPRSEPAPAPSGDGPVALSEPMRRVFETAEKVASSTLPVLLTGETGTGKEVVARAIHERGARREQRMVSVNCGAIPSQLVESTLFGHEKGAFTGAAQRTEGVFEAADGGTVLLDEIGELPAAAQASLLRVLENKRFTRVGSTREIEADVRIVAATHQDLEAMVAAGNFRQDLLFRLNAITLQIPPLRERRDDIEPLALRFLHEAAVANRSRVTRIAADARELLRHYPWPGNVRELRNAIERAVVIARDEAIAVDDLPERVCDLGALAPMVSAAVPREDLSGLSEPINLKAELNRYEATLITRALREAQWDRKTAAELLGIPVRTLGHKIGVHDIKKD